MLVVSNQGRGVVSQHVLTGPVAPGITDCVRLSHPPSVLEKRLAGHSATPPADLATQTRRLATLKPSVSDEANTVDINGITTD